MESPLSNRSGRPEGRGIEAVSRWRAGATAEPNRLCRNRGLYSRHVPAEEIRQNQPGCRRRGGCEQMRSVAQQAEVGNRVVPVSAAGHQDQQRKRNEQQS